MALTRAMLKSMGIEADKIDQIIEAHSETVDGLKNDIDKYKADAMKLPSVQAALDKANEDAKKGEKDTYKVKYDAAIEERNNIKSEYEKYKTDITNKQTLSDKQAAYKDLLKSIKISNNVIDRIVKLTDFDAVELVEGKIKDAESVGKALKSEWSDFISTEGTGKADVPTPPTNNNVDYDKLSDEDYYKVTYKKKGNN
jgi:hypothetical protein